ncbi:hypothetical protein [Novosphingobium percolationis]|uniref:hypothetical protein n=1 Tax=Novosphingobium percolationis TaxID=2871811 RepID=UPI001CD50663|nr:hypothetical protein [Novosphingobium percolationis]
MEQAVHVEAVEQVLSAIYPSGDMLLSSFIIREPGAPNWLRLSGIRTEIFVRREEYTRAVLFIRQNGASYLRGISVLDLRSLVTSFLTENFWYIRDGELGRRHDCSYAEQVDLPGKLALADALSKSALFKPVNALTLCPLIPIRVELKFECPRFFLASTTDLSTDQLPAGVQTKDLDPPCFPPIARWEGIKKPTGSWLGVRSPLLQVSTKIASAILGAVALTSIPRERYSHSQRKMFGGHCTFSGGNCIVSMGDAPHTPPLMNDIVLTTDDHTWLARLAELVDADDLHSRKRVRALEYFYRAWFLDPRERFSLLCMSLDSLVGVKERHTAAAVKFVRDTINTSIPEDRLRLLMRVRGAVIHGAAPDVYDSQHYEQYYLNYETDPILDIELIVAKCLRADIFGDGLKCHADPHADLVADMQARGHLPFRLDDRCIIPWDI